MPCIEFEGMKDKTGYGRILVDGRRVAAHRVEWERVHGPIPTGKVIMHICDNRACVNIGHLQLGTQSENIQDCANKKRHLNARKTHCPQGHEYTDESVFRRADGKRSCKLCDRER